MEARSDARTARPRERGFTLVEALVALVVLAVGLLAIAKMSITYVRANSYSHLLSEATVAAQEKMEQMRSYASSERGDRFSVFDFDYLISTNPTFTSVEDPPGSGIPKTVPGLLSGSNGGSPVTTTGGTVYEVLYDDGNHGDGAAGDGVYGATDTVTIEGTGFTIARTWTVEPIPINGQTNFARVTVECSWTDRFGQTRTVHLESLVHRRQ